MKLVVENGSASPIRTPWPFAGNIAPSETREFVLKDSGIDVLVAMAFCRTSGRLSGVTVRLLRGDPEREVEVVQRGSVPMLIEKT